MTQHDNLKFALASSHSSTVRLFDATRWNIDVRNFPDNLGTLVASAGDLLFFVDIVKDFEEHRAEVIAWNPFIAENKFRFRPRHISRFPSLVRVQLFPPGGYTTTVTDMVVPDNPQNPFISPKLDEETESSESTLSLSSDETQSEETPSLENDDTPSLVHETDNGDPPPESGNLPPPESGDLAPPVIEAMPSYGGFIFTMVGQSDDGATVMENYSSVSDSWISSPCDDWVIREISANGLEPPGVVFRRTHNLEVGNLVTFGCREFFNGGYEIPRPPFRYAPLDDLHAYVFLLQGRLPDDFFLQGERHALRNAHQILFTSPEIRMNSSSSHRTFVFGAKTGALVVQIPRQGPDPSPYTAWLYLINEKSWHQLVDGQNPTWLISKQDLQKALLCQCA